MCSCCHRKSRWVYPRHFLASKDGSNHCDLNNVSSQFKRCISLDISLPSISLESVLFVFLSVVSDQQLSQSDSSWLSRNTGLNLMMSNTVCNGLLSSYGFLAFFVSVPGRCKVQAVSSNSAPFFNLHFKTQVPVFVMSCSWIFVPSRLLTEV